MENALEEKIEKATEKWVDTFNQFNTNMLFELYNNNPDDWELIHPEYNSSVYAPFPMWATMWQFSDSADIYWIEQNIQAMIKCGFCIYRSEQYGYFFGINGCGYNFITEHFIPLYKKRGLKWHK